MRLVTGVHSWQNGTRCRDGVNVLWCRSHLVWPVFKNFIPTCACDFIYTDMHGQSVLYICFKGSGGGFGFVFSITCAINIDC